MSLGGGRWRGREAAWQFCSIVETEGCDCSMWHFVE